MLISGVPGLAVVGMAMRASVVRLVALPVLPALGPRRVRGLLMMICSRYVPGFSIKVSPGIA